MKKYLLLLLIGLCAASCDSYEFSHLESLLDEAWEEYNPYLWDVYKSYSSQERNGYNYYDLDSIPFTNEQGETVQVGVWSFQGIDKIDGAFFLARTTLELFCGEGMQIPLASIDLYWDRKDGKMELRHYNQILFSYCSSSQDRYVEKRYDDYLEFSNEVGDVFLFQKNVGIVRITCHDGRSWTPVR